MNIEHSFPSENRIPVRQRIKEYENKISAEEAKLTTRKRSGRNTVLQGEGKGSNAPSIAASTQLTNEASKTHQTSRQLIESHLDRDAAAPILPTRVKKESTNKLSQKPGKASQRDFNAKEEPEERIRFIKPDRGEGKEGPKNYVDRGEGKEGRPGIDEENYVMMHERRITLDQILRIAEKIEEGNRKYEVGTLYEFTKKWGDNFRDLTLTSGWMNKVIRRGDISETNDMMKKFHRELNEILENPERLSLLSILELNQLIERMQDQKDITKFYKHNSFLSSEIQQAQGQIKALISGRMHEYGMSEKKEFLEMDFSKLPESDEKEFLLALQSNARRESSAIKEFVMIDENKFVDTIISAKGKSYNKLIAQFTTELLNKTHHLFHQLDLEKIRSFDEWKIQSKPLQMLENGLGYLVSHLILNSNTASREKITRFFIEVMERAVKKGNLYIARALLSGFTHPAVERIRDISPAYEKKLKGLESLFWATSVDNKVRETIKGVKKLIMTPSISSFHGRLERAEEVNAFGNQNIELGHTFAIVLDPLLAFLMYTSKLKVAPPDTHFSELTPLESWDEEAEFERSAQLKPFVNR